MSQVTDPLPRTVGVLPPKTTTYQQQVLAEEERSRNAPGLLTAVSDAINTSWIESGFLRALQRQPYEVDPNFNPYRDDDTFNALTNGLDPSYWRAFDESTSLAHAHRIREQQLDVQGSAVRLAQAGWSGVALQFAASVLDPAAIGAVAMTGGFAGPAVWGAKLTRLQRFVRGGALAGAENAALVGVQAAIDPNVDYKDALWAGAVGTLIGGGINVAIAGKMRRLADDIDTIDQMRAMGAASPYGISRQGPDPGRSAEELRALAKSDIQSAENIHEIENVIAKAHQLWDSEDYVNTLADGSIMKKQGNTVTLVHPNGSSRGFVTLRPDGRVVLTMQRSASETAIDVYATMLDSLRQQGLSKVEIPGQLTSGDVWHKAVAKLRARGYTIVEGPGDPAYFVDLRVKPRSPEEARSLLLANTVRATFDDVAYAKFQAATDDAAKADFKTELVKRVAADDPELAKELDELPIDEVFTRLREPTFDPSYKFGVPEDQPKPPSDGDGEGDGPTLDDDGLPPLPPAKAGDFDADNISDAPARFGATRISTVGQGTGTSQSPNVHWLGRALGEDALRPMGDDAANVSTSQWGHRQWQTRMLSFYREHNIAFRRWRKEEGFSILNSHRARKAFNEQVGLSVRMTDEQITANGITNPHVLKVAAKLRGEFKDLLELAQRHGLSGFDQIPENPTYLMRVWSLSKINNAIAAFGEEAVDLVLLGSMRAVRPDVDADALRKAATGFRKAILKTGLKTDVEKATVFSADNEVILREMLTEAGLEQADIENIVTALKPSGDGGLPARAKRRELIDENYRDTATNLGISDFLENDAELLYRAYARQIVGQSAMAKVFRKFGTRIKNADGTPRNFHRWTEVMDAIRNEPGVTDTELRKLDFLYRGNAGLPQGRSKEVTQWTRRLRAIAHINVGGQLGFASIPEVASAVGSLGWKNMMMHMPALRNITRDASTGKLKNELLAELEDVLGWDSPMLHQVTHRMDDTVALEGDNLLDRVLQRAVNVSNYASFLIPVNSMVQRMAALGSTQKIAGLLLSGKKLSPRRLRDLTLTEDDWDQIVAAQKIITEDSAYGKYKVKSLNLDNWDDQEAASKLINAIHRWSGNVSQTNDMGTLPMWMSSDLGAMIMQFRRYTVTAFEKQFLHRVDMRDWEAASSAAASSLMAGLVYTLTTYVNAQGRADKEEHLKQRLTPTAIGAMAFSRGGWSSLWPSIIDTGDYLSGGNGKTFSFGRTTGLDSMFSLSSVPVGNLIASAGRAAAGAGKSLRGVTGAGEENVYSQKDAAQAIRLIPFKRVMGIHQALQALEGAFPEEE
jgi:hypothetical protein